MMHTFYPIYKDHKKGPFFLLQVLSTIFFPKHSQFSQIVIAKTIVSNERTMNQAQDYVV